MTLHFPDQVETNVLTIDATDPKSGTAEFKASAIRVEPAHGRRAHRAGRVAARGAREVAVVDLALDSPPTTAEREAVDGVLGAPASAWVGGERGADGHSARGGHAARAQRASAAAGAPRGAEPGRVDQPGGARYVCRRLTIPPAEAYGVASFYALFALEPRRRS